MAILCNPDAIHFLLTVVVVVVVGGGAGGLVPKATSTTVETADGCSCD